MLKRLFAAAAMLLLCSTVLAGPQAVPTFARKPAVKKDGGNTVIEFAVAGPTDCAVYILDAQGVVVVRHLAAGRLSAAEDVSKKAPAPLKPGLAQSLVWDGKDDLGKMAIPAGGEGSPFKVKVALGLKPTLDQFIGHNPAAVAEVEGNEVCALATGGKGELFVFHDYGTVHPLDNTTVCAVFSRDGKYLRTIMPYPATLPEDKLRGLRRIDLEDGVKAPFIYQAETRSLIPGAGNLPPHRAIATRDGRVAFVGVQEYRRYANAGVNQLVVLNAADGSTPAGADGVLGTVVSPLSSSAASLALSPDEKTIYATGLSEGDYQGKPTHAVYRFGWNDKSPTVFAGDKATAGDDEDLKHLNTPRSVATDKDGNVYVADKGNNRIAVFKPDGSFLGTLPVDAPERVEVNPATGTIYVLGGPAVDVLKKFASWKQTKPLATVNIPAFKHRSYTAVMALDASADPPVLWIGSPQGYYWQAPRLVRVEDRGDTFSPPVDIGRQIDRQPSVGWVPELSVDRQTETVYVGKSLRFDGRTGKLEPLNYAGTDPKTGRIFSILAVGLDGMLYLHRGGNNSQDIGVHRFSRDLKPAPFAEGGLPADRTDSADGKKGSEESEPEKQESVKSAKSVGKPANITTPDWCSPDSTRLRARGLTADAKGNVFVIYQKPFEDNKVFPADDAQAYALAEYGPDGKLIKERLIDAGIRSINSVRVDYQGNVYLAVGLRPGKELLPPGLKGKITQDKKDPDAACGINYYPLIYGSIVKFGPEGGLIRKDIGGVECNYAYGNPIQVKGAKWIYSGASVVPSWRTPGTPDICLCESPRFDVDGFGRSFFPDAGRFRVGVIDANGNEICTFGRYGNQDSVGQVSNPSQASPGWKPEPAIPLCWPHVVAVSDEAAYVGDRLNRRVVRVKLGYQAEETVPVPGK